VQKLIRYLRDIHTVNSMVE